MTPSKPTTASASSAPDAGEVNLTQASPGLRKLLVGASWEFLPTDSEVLDVDLSCFVLGRDNMTREDEDFVFYNNPQGAALSVKHLGDNRGAGQEGDDEAMMIDLDSLSFEVWRIVFVISIYQGFERDQTFKSLKSATLRMENADTGAEIHRLALHGAKMEGATAIRVAEIYRNGVEWFFVPLREPVTAGLAEVAKGYGLLISSTT